MLPTGNVDDSNRATSPRLFNKLEPATQINALAQKPVPSEREVHENEPMTDSSQEGRLKTARVARLATRDAEGRPHLVPVCYAYNGRSFYTAVDGKPKRASARPLKRVRNIEACPEVALLVDEYHEDWTQLWYILVRGKAKLISSGREHSEALRLLREKYLHYASSQLLHDEAPVIQIIPVKITSWGRL